MRYQPLSELPIIPFNVRFCLVVLTLVLCNNTCWINKWSGLLRLANPISFRINRNTLCVYLITRVILKRYDTVCQLQNNSCSIEITILIRVCLFNCIFKEQNVEIKINNYFLTSFSTSTKRIICSSKYIINYESTNKFNKLFKKALFKKRSKNRTNWNVPCV